MKINSRSYTDPTYSHRYGFNGMPEDNELKGEGNSLDFGARFYDPRVGRFLSLDPLYNKYPSESPYISFGDNPIMFVDPDGKEPIKPLAGTFSTFLTVMNNSPSKVGLQTGVYAHYALLKFGQTEWNWKQFKPLPISTPYFNNKQGRYIYTEKGGWIDMTHFLFYAGKAYEYKQDKIKAQEIVNSDKFVYLTPESQLMFLKQASMSPEGEAMQDGYLQEKMDPVCSGYSYEDLPSDKYGADFAVNYFNPNSKQTLGEQLQNYFVNVLKTSTPENAPNYETLPKADQQDGPPTNTNKSTSPYFIKSY